MLVAVLVADSRSAQTYFSEIVEVRVTNVDVIVTGKDGKPVSGLTRADFEVLEDGVPQEVTNFLEVVEPPVGTLADGVATAGAPATAPVPAPGSDPRRRLVTVFIDNAVLQPHRRNQVLPHLSRFMRESIRPGDEVMLTVWSTGLRVTLEPTGDMAAIEAGIEKLAQWTTAGSNPGNEREQFQRDVGTLIDLYANRDPPEKPPVSQVLSLARSVAMRRSHEMRQKIEALRSVMSAMRGSEGRKVLVLVTEALTTNPGDESFYYISSIRDQFEGGQSAPIENDAQAFAISGLVEEIANAANSSGVTMYAIDARGLSGGFNDVDASTNTRVGYRTTVVPETSLTTLRAVADLTGGTAFTGTSNWKLAFDTIAADLRTYYSLGYRTSGERRDRMKKVEVRLKKKGLNVRVRRQVLERSITSEMADAVAAQLFHASATNDLAIEAIAGPPSVGQADTVVVPLTITIPTEQLTLVPEADDLTGAFSVYAAFLRSDGAVGHAAQPAQRFRFPAASLDRRRQITVKLDVSMDARTTGVAIGVMDDMSRVTGFTSVELQSP
jgi:VWFA-related protein